MTRCPLCGSGDHSTAFASTLTKQELLPDEFRATSAAYGVHGEIVRCHQCDLYFIVDDADADSIGDCYADVEDPSYLDGHDGRVATFSRQLDRLERFAEGRGSILEVGAYTGVFLSLARDRGWSVTGIEPSTWAAGEANRLHCVDVRPGVLTRDAFPAGSFDAVVMWDVVEHIPDPAEAVETMLQLVRPGGTIALSTMDIGSFAARISGRRWPWLMSMHRVYFSRSTLRRMLERCGAVDIRFHNHVRYVPAGYLAERMATRFKFLGTTLGAGASVLGAQQIVVPFTIGDLLEVYARKPG